MDSEMNFNLGAAQTQIYGQILGGGGGGGGASALPRPTLAELVVKKRQHVDRQSAKLATLESIIVEGKVMELTAQDLSFLMYPECY